MEQNSSTTTGSLKLTMGAACALALGCFFFMSIYASAQSDAASSAAPQKAKGANRATSPKKPGKAATSASSGPTASSGSHAKSQAQAGTRAKSNTPVAAHKNSTSASFKKTGKRGKRKTTARGQQKIDPERAQAIQEALVREHYLGEAGGTWNEASEAAMRRYQADHGWQAKTVPDSRALISLGLGPSHDHLLNPESAMTTEPASPRAASLTPESHSPDPGNAPAPSSAPAVSAPATSSEHNSSSPQ